MLLGELRYSLCYTATQPLKCYQTVEKRETQQPYVLTLLLSQLPSFWSSKIRLRHKLGPSPPLRVGQARGFWNLGLWSGIFPASPKRQSALFSSIVKERNRNWYSLLQALWPRTTEEFVVELAHILCGQWNSVENFMVGQIRMVWWHLPGGGRDVGDILDGGLP